MWHPDCFSSHVYHLPDPTTTEAEIEQEGCFTKRKKFASIPSCETKQLNSMIFHRRQKKKAPLPVAVTIADEHRKKKKEKAKSTPHKHLLLIETIQPSEIWTKFTESQFSKYTTGVAKSPF